MKIVLLGKIGQLGWELMRSLPPLGEVSVFDFPDFDMSKPDTIKKIMREASPQVVINATAYTAVDKAESERDLATAINATGPGVLAEEAKRLNAVLIHYSTDYVFDGKKGSPYFEEDAVNPLSVYGLSKLQGEQAVQSVGGAHLIFRTSWVYSLRQQGGFVNKVLQWSRQQTHLRMVTDQVSNPTWARMLAEITTQILARGEGYARERVGLYHLAGGGFASRFEWAQMILALDPNKQEQLARELSPALTDEFPLPATRPLFSALDCAKFEHTFNLKIPDWKYALQLAMG
jgi:dTDP-4-dehydrorhamnose reductase